MSERGDFSQREQWALWHPPLYVYMLGLLTKVGGWTPALLRAPGLLGGLTSGLLTFRLAADLTRGPLAERSFAGGIAAGLFFLCPLVIQSALVVDIDFALLLPLTLLFVVLYLRLECRSTAWLVLVPLFAVLLWAKMTNPLPVLGVVLVWQLLRKQFRRAVVHALGVGVGGGALFGVSWALVARWRGFPIDMPFGVNLVQWQDSAEVARRAYTSVGAFVEGLQPMVLWLGPCLVGLGLMSAALRIGELSRNWTPRHVDVLVGLLVVLILGYVNKSAGWFPKYQVAVAPLLACLAAPVLAKGLRSGYLTLLVLVLSTVSVLVVLAVVHDAWALQRSWAIDASAATWLLVGVLAAMVVGGLGRRLAAGGLAGLLGLALGWSVGTDLVQARAPYSTTYWYGTTGTLEAVAWVDTHLRPSETYVSAKEVGVRARDQRFIDQDSLASILETGRGFDGRWSGEPVRTVVAWEREPYTADLFSRNLPSAGFHESARFGDYVIYELSVGR